MSEPDAESSTTPPPLPPPRMVPPAMPAQPMEYASANTPRSETYTEYDRVADTVGLVPNIRGKDNVQQLLAGVAGGVVGAGLYFVFPFRGATASSSIFYAIGGFIVGVLGFGIWLTIRGLIRASNAKRR